MHTIKSLAQKSGVSQHTIRAWEKRYGALSPGRTATNRRLYSEADVEKLGLLQKAIQAGHSIGQVAGLSIPDLQRLLTGSDTPKATFPPAPSVERDAGTADPLEECLAAVERLDADALEISLGRASARIGVMALIDRVLLPLLNRIGENWREGETRPAHEHMATAVLRTFLGRMLSNFDPGERAPLLVVTTPIGQLHELGALIAGIVAATEGWQVLYLGPNLPAEEIAGAALQADARAIALSILYPPDDPRLSQEIVALRLYVGEQMPILAGGRGSAGCRAALESIGAGPIEDFQALRAGLEALRSR